MLLGVKVAIFNSWTVSLSTFSVSKSLCFFFFLCFFILQSEKRLIVTSYKEMDIEGEYVSGK